MPFWDVSDYPIAEWAQDLVSFGPERGTFDSDHSIHRDQHTRTALASPGSLRAYLTRTSYAAWMTPTTRGRVKPTCATRTRMLQGPACNVQRPASNG